MKYITLPKFNPNFLDLGFFQIKWYSLSYIFGLLVAWKIVNFCNEKFELKLYKDKNLFSDDFFFYMIIGMLTGGRLGYVFFYNFSYYMENFPEIFKIWRGGMSFHGGFIGVLISSYLLCKKYKINFSLSLDIAAIATPIGLFFGRIANFINLELYGRKTSFFLGMIFPETDGIPRHPSQLYEAFFEGIVLFLIITFAIKKYKFKIKTLNTSLFLIFYSIFRIFIECFREPDQQVGYLLEYFSLGQILTLPFLFYGVYLLNKIRIKNYKLKQSLVNSKKNTI